MTIKVLATSRNDNVTLNQDHKYIWYRIDGSMMEEYNQSVTRILTPGGLPNLPHIKAAASYGTKTHELITKLLMNQPIIEDSTQSPALASASFIFGQLVDFLDNYKPSDIFKNPETTFEQTFFCDEKFIAEWTSKNGEPYFFGASADVVVDLRAPRGTRVVRVVAEFKTSSQQDKKHILQTAVYMHLANADLGLVIYDDPSIGIVTIERDEAKTLLHAFDSCCADAFLHKLKVSDDNEDVQEIVGITRQITELNQQIKVLTEHRALLLRKICDENTEVDEALANNGVFLGSCYVKNINMTTKTIDKNYLKTHYKKIYEESLTEKTTSYFSFKINGGE